jgi:hypothetical protein
MPSAPAVGLRSGFFVASAQSHWKGQSGLNAGRKGGDGSGGDVPFGADRRQQRRLTGSNRGGNRGAPSPPQQPQAPRLLWPSGLALGPTAAALEASLPNVTTHLGGTVAPAAASLNAARWAATHGLAHQHLSVANMPNM